jgi:ATP-dependent helicase/nuclease subunit B
MTEEARSGGGCTRRFLGRELPLIEHAASRLLDEAAAGVGPIDLRDRLLVLPGSRGGRLLRHALIRGATARGRGVLLPTILTPGGLRERVRLPELPPPPSPAARALAFHQAVAETDPGSLGDLLPHLVPGKESLLAPGPSEEERAIARIAGRLERLAAEMAEEGLSLDTLQGQLRELEGGEEKRRLEAFLRIARDAARRLERVGLTLPFAAPPSGPGVDPGPLLTIGLSDPRPRVRAILEALPRLEAWIHAGEPEAELFDGIGALRHPGAEETGAGAPPPTIRASFPEGSFLIGSNLSRLSAQTVERVTAARARGESATVCVLDDTLHALVVDRLERAGLPVHSALARSADLDAPGRWVEALLLHLEEPDRETVATLLRHPEVETAIAAELLPSSGGSDLLRALDKMLHQSLAASLEDVPASSGDTWLREGIDAHLAPLRGAPRPLADWIEPLRGMVERLFADTEEARLEPLLAGLEMLEAIPPRLGAAMPPTIPLRLLLDHLRRSRAPRAGRGEETVEVIGWLEAELDPAESLIVVGANEGQLPDPGPGHDPLLGPRLRERFGLPGESHRARRDAALVDTLLLSPRTVTWIALRYSTEGDTLHPTRFWLAEDATRPARVIEYYGEEATTDPPPLLLPPAEPGPTLSLPRPIRRDPAPARASVTGLGSYLTCPYTYYLEQVLRLRELHDGLDELDPLAFGNRIHEALELFGEDPTARTLTEVEDVSAALDDFLSVALDRKHGSRRSPVLRVQEEQLRARLAAFAPWQAEQVGEGWQTVAVEATFPDDAPNFRAITPEEPETPGLGAGIEVPFTIRGKVDRIDHHRDHGYRLIDYKSSEGGADPETAHRKGPKGSKEWINLQLPLYHHLATTLPISRPIPGGAAIELGYVQLPRDPRKPSYLPVAWSEEDLAEAIDRAREVAGLIHDQRFWPPRRLRSPWSEHFGGERETGAGARWEAAVEELVASGEEGSE